MQAEILTPLWNKKHRQRKYNLVLRRAQVIIFVVEKQKVLYYKIVCVSV